MKTNKEELYANTLLRWMFVLFPIITVITTELNKSVVIGKLRLVDLIDITVLAPFFLIFLIIFTIKSVNYQCKPKKLFIPFFLLGITLYGHSMHLTGNAINTYATEVNQYVDQIPLDLYQLIFFFDENLGHWLFFGGIFGLLGVWILNDDLRSKSTWQDWVSGLLWGISYSIAITESSHPWLIIPIIIWLVFCITYPIKIFSWMTIKINSSSWVRFGIASIIGLLIGILLVYLLLGGLLQPSEIRIQ